MRGLPNGLRHSWEGARARARPAVTQPRGALLCVRVVMQHSMAHAGQLSAVVVMLLRIVVRAALCVAMALLPVGVTAMAAGAGTLLMLRLRVVQEQHGQVAPACARLKQAARPAARRG